MVSLENTCRLPLPNGSQAGLANNLVCPPIHVCFHCRVLAGLPFRWTIPLKGVVNPMDVDAMFPLMRVGFQSAVCIFAFKCKE